MQLILSVVCQNVWEARAEMPLFQQVYSVSGRDAQELARRMVPGAQILISILPLVTIAGLGVLAYFYMKWEHQKRMLIIEKGGMPPPKRFNEKLLLIGILSVFIGICLTIFFIVQAGWSYELLGGIIPLAAGLGILTYLTMVRFRKN